MKTLSLYSRFTKSLVAVISAAALVAITSTSFAGSMKKDIVDTAVEAGSFTTLATALTEAGLIDTLKGDGPFTVFAPTDEAFAKIPADQLKAILADKELLTSILTYHVVAGKVMAADVAGMKTAPSVQGQDIMISTDSGVMVDESTVVQADIEASNGVIHVIDTVMLPKT